jgi:hypothetical protein
MGDKEEKKKKGSTAPGRRSGVKPLTQSQLRTLFRNSNRQLRAVLNPQAQAVDEQAEKLRRKSKREEASESVKQERREVHAAAERVKREEETTEEGVARRRADASGHRAKREEETPEERVARLAALRTKREEMAEDEKKARREANAARQRVKREAETDEEKKDRRDADAKRKREKKAAEDPQRAERRRRSERARTNPTVRLGSTACMGRHKYSDGSDAPCAADCAGHYPFYMVR